MKKKYLHTIRIWELKIFQYMNTLQGMTNFVNFAFYFFFDFFPF